MIRVFVSSVSKGFEEPRSRLMLGLRKAYDVGAMEEFGAQADPPIDVCLGEVRKSDVVVLIVGPRYGSELPEGISYTHREFREAKRLRIPVLAFSVPAESGLGTEQKKRLDDFLAEVGNDVTYDTVPRSEDLPVEVLASLKKAESQGLLIGRFSLFQSYDRAFALQLGEKPPLFNHEGPFVGRREPLQQLVDFIQGTGDLLVLKAPGGSGKSRLLLEAAKATDTDSASAPKILFVAPDAQWNSEDVNRLPDGPTILVFDDAHRRADLGRLMVACRQKNDQIRCVVSCRPSALELVRRSIGQLLGDDLPQSIDLPPLTKEDADELARLCLGAKFAHLSERLVKLADRNPLIIRVGARCIVAGAVPPDLLEREDERFRTVVLDRLLDDPGLKKGAQVCEKVLEVVACVGPAILGDDKFVANLSDFVDLAEHELRLLLAKLEVAGFLMRRGRLARVSPDVLGDHLLSRAAVDENGRPTRFVEKMIEIFPALLENILANAAELDWRTATDAKHDAVLARIWEERMGFLPRATNRQRAELLGKLKRAALFAPAEVLGIAEWLDDHPNAPVDSELAEWGLEDTPDVVHRTLTEIFGFIAGHPDFTRRCVARLWKAALPDHRPTNQYPEHPRRRFEDLLKYEDRSDWRSPRGVHVQTIEFLLGRLQDVDRKEDAPWAVSQLGVALRRVGEWNRSNRLQLTWGEFSLAKYLPRIADRRRNIMEGLKRIALVGRPPEAKVALHELAQLLCTPRGPITGKPEEGEVAAWQGEAAFAIDALREIATVAPSEIVRFFARRELRVPHPERWSEIAPMLADAWKGCLPGPNEGLLYLLVGPPWGEQLDNIEAEHKRMRELCDRAAEALWDEYRTPAATVGTVLTSIGSLRDFGIQANADQLVRSIVATKPQHSGEVIRALIASEEAGWRLLRPAILDVCERQPDLAVEVLTQLSMAAQDPLRMYALDAAQWIVSRPASPKEVIEMVQKLSQDPSPIVRRMVPEALRRFPGESLSEALKILTSVDWGDDPALGDAVLNALHPKFGLDPNALSDADIDTLLGRITRLNSIEGGGFNILEFVAFASTRRPRQTVEMLLSRVLRDDDGKSDKRRHRFTPIPYGGHGLNLPDLEQAKDYPNILRMIRDALIEANSAARFWLPELFHVCARNLRGGLTVLREWLSSGDANRIVGAAHLLRGFDHGIIFSDHEFMAELLAAAARCGDDCQKSAMSELYCLAGDGTYTSTPGQPAPRHLHDKEQAQKFAQVYSNQPAGYFYDSLVRTAEDHIRQDREHWEEEGDDE